MHESDAKLVERCVKGDARSWETLLEMYTRRIFNMAYRYTGRVELSQELTQDIFLRVYQNLSKFKAQTGSLSNWIMRVGRNLIIDYYQATRKDTAVAGSQELEVMDFQDESDHSGPFENLHQKERAEHLMTGMGRLTPELREAVTLRDIEGFTYQEIADFLEIPSGTVKSRINRGRIELARILTHQSPLGLGVQ